MYQKLFQKKKKSSNVTRKQARQGEGCGRGLAGAGQEGQERGPWRVHPLPGTCTPKLRPPRAHSEGKWLAGVRPRV